MPSLPLPLPLHSFGPRLIVADPGIRPALRTVLFETLSRRPGSGRCAYCGLVLTIFPLRSDAHSKHDRGAAILDTDRTLDHVVPRSRGGTNALVDLVFCCRRCNWSKGNRLLSEWACLLPGSVVLEASEVNHA